MPEDDDGLPTSLLSGRTAAETHMSGCERDGSAWQEETVSEILWQAARPHVMYADFTKRQEGLVGADWLWWWVEGSGEAFGMLIQAKRLHRVGGRWTVGFRDKNGQQMGDLFRTADLFQVPAAYVVYLGGQGFRANWSCGAGHATDCPACARRSVSVLTALQAELAGPSPADGAAAVLNDAVALEDLAGRNPDGPVFDVNLSAAPDDLKRFLLQGQTGARAVARTVFAGVAADRARGFSAAAETRVDIASDAIFSALPDDTGHFREAYFPHVLRGLRHSPPGYVLDALAEAPTTPDIAGHVAGVVVLRI
ncbi:MAG TPA: hypothetical protein VNA20_02930 [Frankiaceae bacterium]|nr:hypothetical protein [Frankiaceae bacterium]